MVYPASLCWLLTRSYAQLLMPKGITVNMISLGFLDNSIGRLPPNARSPGSRAVSQTSSARSIIRCPSRPATSRAPTCWCLRPLYETVVALYRVQRH
jgi:NAD(P)-dependent dehydrogenase (short-subunit alcohol dehydrogenase family)